MISGGPSEGTFSGNVDPRAYFPQYRKNAKESLVRAAAGLSAEVARTTNSQADGVDKYISSYLNRDPLQKGKELDNSVFNPTTGLLPKLIEGGKNLLARILKAI